MSQLSEDKPLYLQIKLYLETEILEGRLKSNTRIPSTNELASFFGINPITVIKGVTLLTDKGMLYKKRGIGMFVSPGAQELIRKQYLASFEADQVTALVRNATRLQLSKQDLHRIIDASWDTQEKEQ